VMFMKRFPKPTPEPDGLQTVYFAGATTANWLCWQVPAVLGIVLADVIPTHWGLGFAGVLALLGLTYSLVSDRTTALAVVVAGGAAVAAFALPLRLNIVVAIAAAVSAGLVFERVSRRAVP
jgi:predicted branched-subunit amino acid permease